MASCASIMALLALRIFMGVAVGPADCADVCLYTGRDWIDKGLDLVYGYKSIKLLGVGVGPCYSVKERTLFVAAVVVLAIIILALLSCIVRSCTVHLRHSNPVVVVRPVLLI